MYKMDDVDGLVWHHWQQAVRYNHTLATFRVLLKPTVRTSCNQTQINITRTTHRSKQSPQL